MVRPVRGRAVPGDVLEDPEALEVWMSEALNVAERAMSARMWRGAVVAALVAAGGCASGSSGWSELGGPQATEMAIQEQAIRYVISYYEPSSSAVPPQAYCVAVASRSSNSVSRRNLDDTEIWIPNRRMVARLGDIEPGVVPASECGRNDDVEVIYGEEAVPAVLISVSRPRFASADQATISVGTRESAVYSFRYSCDVVRSGFGWSVRRCI